MSELAPEEHEDAENDAETQGDDPDDDGSGGDGSNVVTVDFGRKK